MIRFYYLILACTIVYSVRLNAQYPVDLTDRSPYYYYNDNKVYLKIDSSRITVISDGVLSLKEDKKIKFTNFNASFEESYIEKNIIPLSEIPYTTYITEIIFKTGLDAKIYDTIIAHLSKQNSVIKVLPSYISAEQAWQITTGSHSIKIAVFDKGFELDHPDLQNNVYGSGYDAKTGTVPSFVWGTHGTQCAGVVAPGVFVPTTDRQGDLGYSMDDYDMNFSGTSSACPHVAGVAALVLSVNPSLTSEQVQQIICSTAQKLGGYIFQTDSIHPYGTWNNEVGYGLVDAYAAVQVACATITTNFTNQTVTSDTTIVSCGDINVQNVSVQNGAKLSA